MTRVKGGFKTRRRHKEIKKLAKGYYGSRHRLYKRASDAVLHSGEYAFAGRRQRRRDLRRLWITRINAGLKPFNIRYSHFIKLLKDKNIELDRKILADLAATDSKAFEEVVAKVKQ
ncbi:50S ribosomal protein L20 [candidate division WWE3 bacterium RIFCSPHIGHO2_01_FULL_40_23]|uniref:Large ribosomal subunit protein bL20 n=1 Tax=candidate division WWE3 bacterium RIFCSPLOWO2_01_FULL_41_18 TaxID=1802625 RepID=A0A1F4VDR0_UNCKA|nr:MAG: 50S ribosomal protein L20 [candidate division WWE3 bacterium RIFCSPHIGHO2_01_FULL_40_23]OGC55382.1 MAG: 50S ribosomal protein L20 [candidate division WWE3 bacterium RIFCSPLOWO2_01_FULL_41_18]